MGFATLTPTFYHLDRGHTKGSIARVGYAEALCANQRCAGGEGNKDNICHTDSMVLSAP
uniref:Uncharacterized protein n=1 Tax=Candidatus Kentrum sp. TC TaxID=2126339 RepID=A0A451AE58_9GAMM|nr:MAG: hypothetical protein BECKTC1821F_GA0114240_11217 [Candidatus Kentron sp. TC]